MSASKIIVAYSHEVVALSFAAATEPDTTSSEKPEILRPIQPKHTGDICKNKQHVNKGNVVWLCAYLHRAHRFPCVANQKCDIAQLGHRCQELHIFGQTGFVLER